MNGWARFGILKHFRKKAKDRRTFEELYAQLEAVSNVRLAEKLRKKPR
jgi:hypothetical protein